MEDIGNAILEELKELNPAVKFKMYTLNDNPRPIIYGNIPATQLKFPNGCEYDENTMIANKCTANPRSYASFVYAYDCHTK